MILETFYLLFKSNSEDVIKGTKAVKKSADETERSLKTVNDQTKEIGSNFVKLVESGATFLGAFTGFEILKTGVQSAIDFNTQLKLIGENAGVTAEQLRTAGIAAKLFGGTEQMGMQDAIAMAKARRQGLVQGRNPQEMMQNIRNRVSVLPLDQQQNMLEFVYGLSEAGIRQASSNVSDEEFSRKWKQASVTARGTNEAANKAYGANAAEVDLSEETRSFFNRLLETVAPTLVSILNWLRGAVAGTGAVTGAAAIVGGTTLSGVGAVKIIKSLFSGGSAKVAAEVGAEAAGGLSMAGLTGAGALALGDLALIVKGAPHAWEDAKALGSIVQHWIAARVKRTPLSLRSNTHAPSIGPALPVDAGKSVDMSMDVPSMQDLLNSPDALRALDVARGASKTVKNARSTLAAVSDLSPASGCTVNVHIDKIEVATQATDAAGIATGIAGALEDKIYNALSFVAANADNGQSR